MYINQDHFFLFLYKQSTASIIIYCHFFTNIPLKIISTDFVIFIYCNDFFHNPSLSLCSTFPGSYFTTPSSVFVDTRNHWDSGQLVFLGIHRDPNTWRLPGVKSSRQQVTHTNSQSNKTYF